MFPLRSSSLSLLKKDLYILFFLRISTVCFSSFWIWWSSEFSGPLPPVFNFPDHSAVPNKRAYYPPLFSCDSPGKNAESPRFSFSFPPPLLPPPFRVLPCPELTFLGLPSSFSHLVRVLWSIFCPVNNRNKYPFPVLSFFFFWIFFFLPK